MKARLRIEVRGVVQGVGFRPFVYRLATELGLTGWIVNNPQGVRIEVEGSEDALASFLHRLEPERPPQAAIHSLEPTYLDPVGITDFTIRPSEEGGAKQALILPDLATCAECLRELWDPNDRRYRYPFLNCTHCGPRYSIIETLPYDRPHTSMKRFALCPDCRAEYENPLDRRFHAQPTACPKCGPQLEWRDTTGQTLASGEEALQRAAAAIREGAIAAVKGLGGFHLMVDARNEAAVQRLRVRKQREAKPLAIMIAGPTPPSAFTPSCPPLTRGGWGGKEAADGNLTSLNSILQEFCTVSEMEERLLGSPQAPILLLERVDAQGSLAPSVAPGQPCLGVMRPYTPLHHLLMAELGFPIVATSGNRSDEPICTDEDEAVIRLEGIADGFLVHNRPIVRPVDDSVARVVMGREMLLRRARGYAPLPIPLPAPLARPTLAVGAHLKNAVAIGIGGQAFVSQHIGDLETLQAVHAFERAIADLIALYAIPPEQVVCDLHPDYRSTHYAERTGLPLTQVQHHHAHVLACMAENELRGPVLGAAWDGTGYGTDGAIWGGEFLRAEGSAMVRVAHLRAFPLPGSDRAVREPRRTALGLLYAMHGEAAFGQESLFFLSGFSTSEYRVLHTMLQKGLNAPQTSSIGRLFDAVAALLGIRQETQFEGQAAQELEAAALQESAMDAYPLPLRQEQHAVCAILDWEPMVAALLEDLRQGVRSGVMARRFHNALAAGVVQVAQEVGVEQVALTGGCFLNRLLLEQTVFQLRNSGFRPYWHQRVPPGDGGIALGQLMALAETAQ